MSVVADRTTATVAGVARQARAARWAAYVEQARAESLENRRCSRRVRYEARDALGVVAFSAAASTATSILVAVLLSLVG